MPRFAFAYAGEILKKITVKHLKFWQLHRLLKNEYLRHFPREERKPYTTIMQLVLRRCYDGYGLYQGNKLCAYALVMKNRGDVLLDYFAVQEDLRGQGVGTKFLNMLCHMFLQRGHTVFAEIEMEDESDPKERAAEKAARQKFYTDNGWQVTRASLTLFDVDYKIIVNGGSACSDREAKERVDSFYRTSIIAPVYKRKVFWHDLDDGE